MTSRRQPQLSSASLPSWADNVLSRDARRSLDSQRAEAKREAAAALEPLKAYCLPNDTKWPTWDELHRVDSAMHQLARLYRRKTTGTRMRRTTPWQDIVTVQQNLPRLNAERIVTSLISRAAQRIEAAGTPEMERIMALSQEKTKVGRQASRFLKNLRRLQRIASFSRSHQMG